ncbi:TetR/AcrR family transcriptional regulator [Gordonia sp. DT30]|uniref:TetR/AcrR family transcriptional regulator n=1 Tax=Gordonia sp. DT30 TaxID=3416546 RepID=UPI003CEEAE21
MNSEERPSDEAPTRVATTQLLAVAGDLLARYGPSALTARRIAKAAGTSTMVIYSRFGATGALHAALRSDGFAHLGMLTASATAGIDDPVMALASASVAYLDFGVAQPHRYRFLFVEPARGDEPGRAAFTSLRALIDGCVAAGRFHPDDPDEQKIVTIWAAQVWALQHGVTSLVLTGTVPAEAAHHVLVDGLTRLCIGYGDDPGRARHSTALRAAGDEF